MDRRISAALLLMPSLVLAQPRILETHVAAPNALAVTLETTSNETGTNPMPDTLNLAVSGWRVNGTVPLAIWHKSVPWREAPVNASGQFPVTVRHTVYPVMATPLQSGTTYHVVTPYGTQDLVFDERSTWCESIKVNQAGYASGATTRFANYGVYLGDGGTWTFPSLPTFSVLNASGQVVLTGTALDMGDDVGTTGPRSGEHVYRLPIESLGDGGPYSILVPGCGRSRTFGVGQAYTRQATETVETGLFVSRCGQELRPPWVPWTRAACHTAVADTRTAPWVPTGFIQVPAGTPAFPIRGGRHDAGDYDRRPMHTIIPIVLMSTYEGWPSHFRDGQYKIPEAGNGIPDVIDEALWDVLGWEYLQITDRASPLFGGVRSGTEECAHPTYGVHHAAQDRCAYGTWQVDGPAGSSAEGLTAYVAGIFAQASRLLRPYDLTLSGVLLQRARDAWGYHTRVNGTAQIRTYNLYAALQLYLATGETGFHDLFRTQAQPIVVQASTWPHVYLPGNFGESGAQCQTVHFASYTLTTRPTDVALLAATKAKVTSHADLGGYMNFRPAQAPYPVAANKFYGWGAITAPGRFDAPAWASLYTADAAKSQQYYDVMSLEADGVLGLNALGMSYVVGLGTDQPNEPLHLDSYFSRRDTGSLLPGVMVYGPSDGEPGVPYERAITGKLFPGWSALPITRRYAHGWSAVQRNEDSPWQVRVWMLSLMGYLHDASKDVPILPPSSPDAGTTVDASIPTPDVVDVTARDVVTDGGMDALPFVCVQPPVPVCGPLAH